MRGLRTILIASLVAAACKGQASAGLHLSTERCAELPAQWRGFLNDLRLLRGIGIKPSGGMPGSPKREEYSLEAARLQGLAKERPLTAEEAADLGAILIRLGDYEAALERLRGAQRDHPGHFALLANLGTAWQLYGDLERAEDALRAAVSLAPDRHRAGERLHLRLVQARLRDPNGQGLDDLGIPSPGEPYAAGPWPAERIKQLPPDAVAGVQQLLLWLPFDGRLHWQLAELANAHGDVRIAAELFDLCASQFNLTSPTLRRHRQVVMAAQAARNKKDAASGLGGEHFETPSTIPFKSRRPLIPRPFDVASLPPINRTGVNSLPWGLLAETTLDRRFRPTFPPRLRDMEGVKVAVSGFMQPLTEDLEFTTFLLIEYPTGCWFCEMPEITGIVLVELAGGKTVSLGRDIIKVTGKLKVNATDPEDFIYTISDAQVTEPD